MQREEDRIHGSQPEERKIKELKRIEYNDTYHLNETIKEILAYNKEDGYDKFEEISMYIKRKMTKLSFQYVIPKYEPKRCIELTPHEEAIFVSFIIKLQYRKI
jgi:hypothetical protein